MDLISLNYNNKKCIFIIDCLDKIYIVILNITYRRRLAKGMVHLILYFTVYSILGWICECVYCAAIDRVWVNASTFSCCSTVRWFESFVIFIPPKDFYTLFKYTT